MIFKKTTTKELELEYGLTVGDAAPGMTVYVSTMRPYGPEASTIAKRLLLSEQLQKELRRADTEPEVARATNAALLAMALTEHDLPDVLRQAYADIVGNMLITLVDYVEPEKKKVEVWFTFEWSAGGGVAIVWYLDNMSVKEAIPLLTMDEGEPFTYPKSSWQVLT